VMCGLYCYTTTLSPHFVGIVYSFSVVCCITTAWKNSDADQAFDHVGISNPRPIRQTGAGQHSMAIAIDPRAPADSATTHLEWSGARHAGWL
jgi:hypothetical protein